MQLAPNHPTWPITQADEAQVLTSWALHTYSPAASVFPRVLPSAPFPAPVVLARPATAFVIFQCGQ